MTQVAVRPGPIVSGSLVYSVAENSFRFDCPQPDLMGGDLSMVAFKDLQISVAVGTGQLLFAWGYSPYRSWSWGGVKFPELVADAQVLVSGSLYSGESIDARPASEWSTTYDPTSGLVRFDCADSASEFVRICDGVVVGLHGDEVVGLLLHPRFEV